MYRRGLYITGNRDNAPPERTQSLPASSRESSTEPMDTDDARRASEEIYRRIRQQAGLRKSGSVGDLTLQPEPLGVMTESWFSEGGHPSSLRPDNLVLKILKQLLGQWGEIPY